MPTFMIQGGGFTEPKGNEPMKEKPTNPPIKNESGNGLSNLRGTISLNTRLCARSSCCASVNCFRTSSLGAIFASSSYIASAPFSAASSFTTARSVPLCNSAQRRARSTTDSRYSPARRPSRATSPPSSPRVSPPPPPAVAKYRAAPGCLPVPPAPGNCARSPSHRATPASTR